MTRPVSVLFVTPHERTGERLESLFADERPGIAFSFVTSVERAVVAAGTERVDYVVLDSSLTDGGDAEARLRRAADDVSVETVRWDGPEVGPEPVGERFRRTATERLGALVARIEDAVASRAASLDGVEGEQFRALAEELTDVVLVIDAESTVHYANPAVSEVFGYRPEELVGESLTELMPDDLAESHRAGLRRYLREGERAIDWNYVELPGQRRDGTEVPLGVSFSEFATTDDVLFTGIVRDISERKRQESELHDRVRQQEALSEFTRHALEDWSVADLLDEAAELVAETLGHEYAGVLKYRPDRDDLVARATVGWSDDDTAGVSIGTERDSQAGYTLLSEEPVVVEDLSTEERFSGSEPLESGDVVSGISVVIGSPENPWGILRTHATTEQSYAEHDVQFVRNIANILTTVLQRHEHARRFERSQAMLDAVDDGVYALDSDARFVAVNDAYLELTGYDREQLLGEHASTVLGEDLYEDAKWIQEAIENEEEVVTLEVEFPTADGGSVPVEARVAPLSLGDSTGQVGVVRDVSDRKRREEKLRSLNELFQSLTETETPADICTLGVGAAVETLGFPNAAVALYDDEKSGLVPTVKRWRGDEIDAALLGDHAQGAAWRAFVTNETKVFEDSDAELDGPAEMASALAIPLSKYGVFLTASPEPEAFDATDRSLADMLCSNLRTALDRADREETLRDQRNDLREKNTELERVNRLNSVIRDITKALTQASSRDEMMQAVCDRLTETGPYRFAWFGSHDRATDEISPEAWAGVHRDYLESALMTGDEDDLHGNGPAGRAVRSAEVQVQNDLLGDPPFDPWREQALERGYRSCVSIPILYDDRLRGILSVYADEAGTFDELEGAVLSELGETIGYALNALEQKQALVSERSIELDFRIRGTDSPIFAFVRETGAEFEFENAVQRADGRLYAFFTIRDADPEKTLAFAESVSWIEDARLVTERDEEYLYECALADRTFLQSLMDRGAMPQSLTATGTEGRFVVRLPQRADVRTFVTLFEDYYEEAELVARRERDEPVMTRQDFESELTGRLTDRQAEVLQLAYFGGYFKWPRESTAEEIAESLDVSQPTVSRHIRNAEHELFGLLFGDE